MKVRVHQTPLLVMLAALLLLAGAAGAEPAPLSAKMEHLLLTAELNVGGQSVSVTTSEYAPIPAPMRVGYSPAAALDPTQKLTSASPLLSGGAVSLDRLWDGAGGAVYAILDVVPLLPDETLTVRTSSGRSTAHHVVFEEGQPALRTAGFSRDIPRFGEFEERLDALRGYGGGVGAGDEAASSRFAYAPTDGVDSDRLHYAPAAGPASGAGDGDAEDGGLSTSASAAAPAAPADAYARARAAAVVAAAVATPLTLIGWALYHRIRGSSTLDNDTRKKVFDAVCSQPGVGVNEVAQHAGVSYSTTIYHLERLSKEGMIVVSSAAGKLRYYKNGGSFNEEERRVIPVLQNAEAMRVLHAILDSPGTFRRVLAERLGVTPTTINWHLKRLTALGLIQEVRQGRNAYLSVDAARLEQLVGPLVPKLDGVEPDTASAARRALGMPALAATATTPAGIATASGADGATA